MHPELLSKRILLIIAISGLTLQAALFLYFIPKNSIQDSSALLAGYFASANQEQTNNELPARFKIPSIGVDASVEYVGLTPDGAMDVPSGPDEVAWFNLGPRPGESGSAVIAGHFGWENSKPAVFDNLYKLGVGDKVLVEDGRGITTSFVVREMRVYSKDEAAPDVFGSSDGEAHLNLITCIGVWNEAEQTPSERLVVFTDKE